ncbi:MAG: hypothetical protein OQK82_01350 [Candidatus Pacearchaeota archaeon]|nr:hypothetical protein [Candidatus Pacearchaeota archaeon]
MKSSRELGIRILAVIHHHEHENPIPSGIRWCLGAIHEHMSETNSDIMSAISWLKRKDLVKEEKGSVVLTDRGRKLIEP